MPDESSARSNNQNPRQNQPNDQDRERHRQTMRRLRIAALSCLAAWSILPAFIHKPQQQTPAPTPNGQTQSGATSANITSSTITATTPSGQKIVLNNPQIVVQQPQQQQQQQQNPMENLLIGMLPTVLLLGGLYWVMKRSMKGAGGGILGMTKTKGQVTEVPNVGWDDVAAPDEVKSRLKGVSDFLNDPAKYRALGGRVPRGVLLFGPPGTGKTLMARAVAHESGVPFFHMSGSDFVEMVVGVGAARVRSLFKQAKACPDGAIIFIDELDAVGGQRGNNPFGGGHDEKEQTLNAILTEMDGFDQNDNVVVIAATNLQKKLDSALTRKGRFDRQVEVGYPNAPNRRQILGIHTKGIPLSQGAQDALDDIAHGAIGLTGADLATACNEASLIAADRGATEVSEADLRSGILEAQAGPESGKVMSAEEIQLVAWHEAGHAVTAQLQPHADEVQGISIVPRARSLGHTMILPDKDRMLDSRDQLIARMIDLAGGRVAEEMLRGEGGVTTGAENDLDVATEIATAMVGRWALTDLAPTVAKAVGPDGRPILNKEQQAKVDELMVQARDKAREILGANRDMLEAVATELAERQNMTRPEFEAIIARMSSQLTLDVAGATAAPAPRQAPQLVAGPGAEGLVGS